MLLRLILLTTLIFAAGCHPSPPSPTSTPPSTATPIPTNTPTPTPTAVAHSSKLPVRSLAMHPKWGLVVGHAATAPVNPGDFLTITDGKEETRVNCGTDPIAQVNDIVVTSDGTIYFTVDAQSPDRPAVYVITSPTDCHSVSMQEDLPDYRGYGLFAADQSVYVATHEGLGKFWEGKWFSANDELHPTRQDKFLHAVTQIGDTGTMVFGYANGGLDFNTMGKVVSVTATSHPEALKSNSVRTLWVDTDTLEVWVGTDPVPALGITDALSSCIYCTGDNAQWTFHPVPSVLELGRDAYGRLWAAGLQGVYVQHSSGEWEKLTDQPTTSLAFGCDECIVKAPTVYLGTYEGLKFTNLKP